MPDFAVSTALKMNSNVSVVMAKNARSTQKFGDAATANFKRASQAGSRFRDVTKGILAAGLIQRGGRALLDIGKKAIGLASDLTEVQNVVDVTFGAMKDDINSFSKTALKQFGLSELQAKQFAGTFGALIKSSGVSKDSMLKMSKGLTGLTGDFASFYNLPHDVAFQKLRAGISGETEPLKQLGINMSVANLEAFALTRGITKSWKSMGQAAQVQLRYNFLMEKSKDAQGDFNRTLSTSFANQKRVLSTKFDQALAKIATKILPMLTEGFKFMNAQMAKIDTEALGEGLKTFGSVVGSILKIVLKLLPLLPILIKGFILWKTVMISIQAIGWIKFLFMMRAAILQAVIMQAIQTKAMIAAAIATKLAAAATWFFGAAMAFLTSPITLVILAIAALIAIGILLYKNWDVVKAVMLGVWENIKNGANLMWSGIKIGMLTVADIFMTTWGNVFKFILMGFSKVQGALGGDTSTVDAMIAKVEALQKSVRSGSAFGVDGGTAPNAGTGGNKIDVTNTVNINNKSDSDVDVSAPQIDQPLGQN